MLEGFDVPPEDAGESPLQNKSWSWKMESIRPTTRKLPAKMAGIAGSRMIGVKVRV